jgi:hypothetical protein
MPVGTWMSAFTVTIVIRTSSGTARLGGELTSRGRALLMFFSDVGENDAPTRIRVGAHLDMARVLEPVGETGMSQMNLEHMGAGRPKALAARGAGTVYLCHPFLVHAAQRHLGSTPRFMAQPPLGLAEPYRLDRQEGAYSPVEVAVRQALQRRPPS